MHLSWQRTQRNSAQLPQPGLESRPLVTVPVIQYLCLTKQLFFSFSRLHSRAQELSEGGTRCVFSGNVQNKNPKDKMTCSSLSLMKRRSTHVKLSYISWRLSGSRSHRWHPRCVAQSGTYLCWAKAVCCSYSDGEIVVFFLIVVAVCFILSE